MILKVNGKDIYTKLTDLSSEGCFVRLPNPSMSGQTGPVTIKFNLQGANFTLESNIIWENKGQNSKFPKGFGMVFAESKPEIYDLARVMLFETAKAKVVRLNNDDSEASTKLSRALGLMDSAQSVQREPNRVYKQDFENVN